LNPNSNADFFTRVRERRTTVVEFTTVSGGQKNYSWGDGEGK